MNKKQLDKFLTELKNIFDKHLNYNNLSDLTRSADLFIDTLKQEQPLFKKECKLNGKPSIGYCTDKELYNDCLIPKFGKQTKHNWMCWRDGVLIE